MENKGKSLDFYVRDSELSFSYGKDAGDDIALLIKSKSFSDGIHFHLSAENSIAFGFRCEDVDGLIKFLKDYKRYLEKIFEC